MDLFVDEQLIFAISYKKFVRSSGTAGSALIFAFPIFSRNGENIRTYDLHCMVKII